MLINKTTEQMTVTYNGKSRILAPQESIDIRDFDVVNEHVSGAEKHIMNKNPGKLEQKPTTGASTVDKENIKKIKELEDRVVVLAKEKLDIRAASDEMQQKFSAMAGEVETARQTVASMKKEVDKYKFENKELEEEVTNLRADVAQSGLR